MAVVKEPWTTTICDSVAKYHTRALRDQGLGHEGPGVGDEFRCGAGHERQNLTNGWLRFSLMFAK